MNKKLIFAMIAMVIVVASSSGVMARDNQYSGPPNGPWTLHVGFGSTRFYDVISITREMPLTGNWCWYLGAGLGDIFVGGGVAWYQHPQTDGLAVSFNAGLVGLHANVCYLFKVGSQSHLTLGASVGRGDFWAPKALGDIRPVVAYEYRFKFPI
jgi:hypothetical protein